MGERRRKVRTHRARMTRRWIFIVAGVFVALALWVGIRGALAAQQLSSAVPATTALKAAIVAGDSTAAEQDAAALSAATGQAVSLTSDVVWRAGEVIPFVGQNLRAIRLASEATDVVAGQVVTPLISLSASGGFSHLAPKDGTIDYSILTAAADDTAAASGAALHAQTLLGDIDRRFLLPPLETALTTLTGAVDTAAAATHAIDAVTHVIPSMLGETQPTNTLLLFQNPAELRATGGLMGAMALIHADKGHIGLVRQSTGGDLNHNITPPLAVLDDDTKAVFGLQPARLISDVNLTPDFAQSAKVVATVWEQKFGEKVSSAISLDPVGLSYVLAATGPITLPTGQVISSQNAVSFLLTDVYFQLDEPQQNAVFESVAAAVFERIASGHANATALVSALVRAGEEHRAFVWNADPVAQQFISGTTLAGLLPQASAGNPAFGFYLNDATASKMDTYLNTSVKAGYLEKCRVDERPTAIFEITMTNTAPTNAGKDFPPGVTGAGAHGTPAGNIRTAVTMYGPKDGIWGQSLVNGAGDPVFTVTTSRFATATKLVELAPGESVTQTFRMLMPASVAGASLAANTIATPALHFSLEEKQELDCGIGLR